MEPALRPEERAAVEAYVDETLRGMPEHLRLGVAAESLLFGAAPWLSHRVGLGRPGSVERRIERWRSSNFDPLRQYVRLLHSLVLFAENELVPEPA